MTSLPKIPSSKSKEGGLANAHAHTAMTSFDRANIVLQEIESFLESELAETPQLSASDNVIRPKSKRKRGPFLIKDISKNKTRKTQDGMVYDPVLGVWVGNSDALKGFTAVPHLITSKSRSDKSKSVGGMVWDPVAQKWIGNDADLRPFEKRKVALITGGGFKFTGWRLMINDVASLYKENLHNSVQLSNLRCSNDKGMSFDPVRMTWVGGEDDMPDFGISDASPQKDDGFVVGTEFQLSPATIQQFTECADTHKTNTTGWWREEKTRDYLSVIRTMSVMRLVRDVRRSASSLYEEPSFMDIAVEKELPLKSPRAEPETDFDDAWDDMGPSDNFTLKLRDRDNSVDDLDAELDKLSKDDKEKKFASLGNRSGKVVVDEDWDDDFAAEDLKILPNKLTSNYKPIPSFDNTSPSISSPSTSSPNPTTRGTITNLSKGGSINKKPFELLKVDAPHRRSFQLLPVEKKPAKIAWEDDEEVGLEIPSGPLRLKASGDSSNAGDDDSQISLDDDDVPSQEPANGFDHDEVEEEDWDDVTLPAKLGDPVTKRVPSGLKTQQVPELEEWDDFEIPADKIELKVTQKHQQRQTKSRSRGDEDDVDGLDIPEGMQLRLKR